MKKTYNIRFSGWCEVEATSRKEAEDYFWANLPTVCSNDYWDIDEISTDARDVEAGTYNGYTTYCPQMCYGSCPDCDQCGICHNDDPQEECETWQNVNPSWNDWELAQ